MEVKRSEGRFFAKTEHGTAELLYSHIDKATISAYHTFTPEEDRHKGVAEQLAIAAFKYAKERELRIRPDCPYIPYFLSKHKEWRKYATG